MYRNDNPPKLLHWANGKPHASEDDHESAAPARLRTKPALSSRRERRSIYSQNSLPNPDSMRSSQTIKSRSRTRKELEEDVDRDPESSSDTEHAKVSSSANSSFKALDTSDLVDNDEPRRTSESFRSSGLEKENNERGKRESLSDDAEPEWMSKPSPKRQKVIPRARSDFTKKKNIHVIAPRLKTYGNKGAANQPATKGFKKADSIMPEQSPPKTGGFKTFATFGLPQSSGTSFKSISSALDIQDDFQDVNDLCSLTSAENSPNAKSAAASAAEEPIPYSADLQCEMCEAEVPRWTYEEFVGRHDLSEPLPYKWKRRFCRHHRIESAKDSRISKGYPDVNWSRLGGRMRKHDEYLISILCDTTESHYRAALKDKVQPRKKAILQHLEGDDAKQVGCVGYYGPKGAKLMTEHIMEGQSDELRQRATVDKLVSSSGVQGGVTGFVQAVLVPHLAELLIKEDMRLGDDGDWAERARHIIAESTDLGELLYPVAQDQIEDDSGSEDED